MNNCVCVTIVYLDDSPFLNGVAIACEPLIGKDPKIDIVRLALFPLSSFSCFKLNTFVTHYPKMSFVFSANRLISLNTKWCRKQNHHNEKKKDFFPNLESGQLLFPHA